MVATVVLLAASSPVPADPLVFTPRLSVSEEYNDNIFFTSNKTYDFITSITPGLTLQYRQPTLTFTLNASNSAQIFARDTSQTNGASHAERHPLRVLPGVTAPHLHGGRRGDPRDADADGKSAVLRAARAAGRGAAAAPAAPLRHEHPGRERRRAVQLLRAQASYAFTPTWSAGGQLFEQPEQLQRAKAGRISPIPPGCRCATRGTRALVLRCHIRTRISARAHAPDTDSNAITAGGAYAFAQTWAVSGSPGCTSTARGVGRQQRRQRGGSHLLGHAQQELRACVGAARRHPGRHVASAGGGRRLPDDLGVH